MVFNLEYLYDMLAISHAIVVFYYKYYLDLQAKGKDIILESEDMAVACNKERKLITISI